MGLKDMDLDALIDLHAETNKKIKALGLMKDKMSEELLRRLDEADAKTIDTPRGRRVTKVQGQLTDWDVKTLKTLLGNRWAEVVVESFDKEKLTQLLDTGRATEAELNEAMIVKDKKAYPLVS